MKAQRTILALLLAAGCSAAMAHPGHPEGFLAAVAHPWLGWDHLLAMVLVGVLAASYSGLKGLTLPVAFVASLTAAAAWASLGGGAAFVPYVESAILASLLVLAGWLPRLGNFRGRCWPRSSGCWDSATALPTASSCRRPRALPWQAWPSRRLCCMRRGLHFPGAWASALPGSCGRWA